MQADRLDCFNSLYQDLFETYQEKETNAASVLCALFYILAIQTANYLIKTADCRLPTADCGLPTADCGLPTAD